MLLEPFLALTGRSRPHHQAGHRPQPGLAPLPERDHACCSSVQVVDVTGDVFPHAQTQSRALDNDHPAPRTRTDRRARPATTTTRLSAAGIIAPRHTSATRCTSSAQAATSGLATPHGLWRLRRRIRHAWHRCGSGAGVPREQRECPERATSPGGGPSLGRSGDPQQAPPHGHRAGDRRDHSRARDGDRLASQRSLHRDDDWHHPQRLLVRRRCRHCRRDLLLG